MCLRAKTGFTKCKEQVPFKFNPLESGKFFLEFFAQVCRAGVFYDQTDRVNVIL
jgi:hypothetical protein